MTTRPLHLRTHTLIIFEAMRIVLVLGIIGWWGWLLLDKTRIIISLESELALRDTQYIPLYDDHKMLRMITTEAAALLGLVLASSVLSFWLCLRDIRRTRAVQGFFAAMAHELRTPLASISLQLEGLKSQAESPYLLRLREDAARLETQLERGLELARSESGKALALTPVSLEEIWQRLALPPVLQILGEPQGRVLADAHAIQVIFRNIVENALIHGKATQLEISQQISPPKGRREAWGLGRNRLNARSAVIISFRDNGVGCSEKPQKLGRLFFKGHDSKGTGVGLYLVKALMKQMGGKAEFVCDKGFGITLTFQSAP